MQHYQIGVYEKAIPEEYSITEMLKISKEAGYHFFEINIDRTEKRIARVYSQEYVEEADEAMKHCGIRIGSLGLSALGTYTLGNPDDAIASKGRDIFEKSVLFAEKLGIRTIQIPACDVPKDAEHTADSHRRFCIALKECAEFAAAHGVLLGLENMEDAYADTIQKSMRIINEVNSPFLHMYPDSGNIMNAAIINETDIEADMNNAQNRCIAFHLKEARPGKYGGLFYGDGCVDFNKIVATAWKLGIRRYVMEYWFIGNKNWRDDLRIAREFCESMLRNHS